MSNPCRYTFPPATVADVPLIARWLRLPHVVRWWGADATFDVGKLTDARVDVPMVASAPVMPRAPVG